MNLPKFSKDLQDHLRHKCKVPMMLSNISIQNNHHSRGFNTHRRRESISALGLNPFDGNILPFLQKLRWIYQVWYICNIGTNGFCRYVHCGITTIFKRYAEITRRVRTSQQYLSKKGINDEKNFRSCPCLIWGYLRSSAPHSTKCVKWRTVKSSRTDLYVLGKGFLAYMRYVDREAHLVNNHNLTALDCDELRNQAMTLK